jgi:hypothetical protein
LPFAPSISRSSTRQLKTILAAERFDLLAQAFDDRDQPKRADVRLGDVENLFRSTGLDEFGQHLAAVMVRVLDLAVELAVRERAGAAFAELHVRFRIEHRLAPQAPGVLGAFRTTLPRSRMIGRKPIWASTSAASSPHGPVPTITGRGA